MRTQIVGAFEHIITLRISDILMLWTSIMNVPPPSPDVYFFSSITNSVQIMLSVILKRTISVFERRQITSLIIRRVTSKFPCLCKLMCVIIL